VKERERRERERRERERRERERRERERRERERRERERRERERRERLRKETGRTADPLHEDWGVVHAASKNVGAEETILPADVLSIGTSSMYTAFRSLSTDVEASVSRFTQPEKFKRATSKLENHHYKKGGVVDNLPESLKPIAILMRDLLERQ
jgi:hypothetical protein